MVNHLVRHDGIAIWLVQGRYRHAPGPLPRDAPLAAPLDESLKPVLSRLGHKTHLVQCSQGLILNSVHVGKPLGCSPDDNGLLGPPVVGVLVPVLVNVQDMLSQQTQHSSAAAIEHRNAR